MIRSKRVSRLISIKLYISIKVKLDNYCGLEIIDISIFFFLNKKKEEEEINDITLLFYDFHACRFSWW